MTGSAEFCLIAACCKWPETPERDAEIRALAREQLDWQSLSALTRKHRVEGMVFAALLSAQAVLPRDIHRNLAVQALRIKQQNISSAAETVRIQRQLDAANIPAIFFKGVALAQLAYGRLDIKHSKDIDFLVPPEKMRECTHLLEQHGYRLTKPHPRFSPAQWRKLLVFYREIELIDPVKLLQVEPHWRMSWLAPLLAYLHARSPTIDVDLPGFGTVRSVTRDDLFVYLCFHGAQHGWLRLKWLADLHALLASQSHAEIERLYDYGQRVSGHAFAKVALRLCATLFGLDLPPRIVAEIAANRIANQIYAISLANLTGADEELSLPQLMRLHLLCAASRGHFLSQLWFIVVGGKQAVLSPLPRWAYILSLPVAMPVRLWQRFGAGRSASSGQGQ